MARPKNTRTVETPWPFGMRVGSMRDAEKAVDGLLQRVGQGAMRTVYVNKAGTVVYKLSIRNRNAANESEYAEMVRLHSIPQYRQHTTPVALYHVDGTAVIAMVCRPGESFEATDRQQSLFQTRCGRLPDMHRNNWRATPKGRAKITDIGEVRW